MTLACNTRHLLDAVPAGQSPESVSIEYHMLSWREIYDKSIITADRYSSGAARWVIRGGDRFYKVTVVSRPYYKLPQELCLSFECFLQKSETKSGSVNINQNSFPFEQVATEFAVLLSVFAREPLVLLGLRRQGDQPIADTPYRIYQQGLDRSSAPLPFGIDSSDFLAVISGLAYASSDVVQAILGAAKFYHSGLSLIGFDPSVAYVAFVSAIECLAGCHYRERKFDFDTVPKFEGAREVLARIASLEGTQDDVMQLKEELIRSEHFLRQKFVLFLTEHVTEEFWEVPDELYPYSSSFPAINKENFQRCLRDAYDARSSYVHGGRPYPEYIDFGLREKSPVNAVTQLMQLNDKQRFIPPLSWFERLSHITILRYMQNSLAPQVAQAEAAKLAEKERVLKLLSSLPNSVQDSLRRLVLWTARFLGYCLINPLAPNKEWADSSETVEILKQHGIIQGQGDDLDGSSWLKDREIGEIAGAFVYGDAKNPFRNNELLLPKDMISCQSTTE
jgi:hypothetical protein